MSANLHPTGKRPVLRRMPQNVRLPYDVQGLFPGVGASAAISKQPEKRRFHSVSCEMLATVDGQQDAFPGVGVTAPISKQSEKGRFCSASCKMVVSLMTYKAFFKELERSSNLPDDRR